MQFIIETTHPDFSKTGLKVSSKVRVSRIVTIERNLITRKLGNLETGLLNELDNKLRHTFKL